MSEPRDHGGNLDAAIAAYGGARQDWIDLSTGINPVPYPVSTLPPEVWTSLPDQLAQDRMIQAARRFWNVPPEAGIIAAPGASALISRMPELSDQTTVHIPAPTYNEHAAAFALHGYSDDPGAAVRVLVHPNNPDGRLWPRNAIVSAHRDLTIIDESFCDVAPEASHVELTKEPGIVVLKSFGKFWGLAGVRLGFAIGLPQTMARPGWGKQSPVDLAPVDLAPVDLAEIMGPWAVSGAALALGARALEDADWARATRQRLAEDAARLDGFMGQVGQVVGGSTLFRLYDVADAAGMQHHLAQHRIHSRIFPYSNTWLRLGLPHPDRWGQLEAAIQAFSPNARSRHRP